MNLLLLLMLIGQGKATHGASLLFSTASACSVSVLDNNSLDFSTVYSVEAWVKVNSWYIAGGNNEISTKNNAYFLSYDPYTGKFEVYNYGTLPNPGWHISKNVTPLNIWTYIAVTFLVGDSIRLFYNGQRDTLFQISSGSITNTTTSIQIGNSAGGRRLNGYIKQVRYYKRILTPAEIAWNNNHPEKPFSTDSIKPWLKFNEYTGAVVYDSSGLANNGTIYNAIWSLDSPVKSGGN